MKTSTYGPIQFLVVPLLLVAMGWGTVARAQTHEPAAKAATATVAAPTSDSSSVTPPAPASATSHSSDWDRQDEQSDRTRTNRDREASERDLDDADRAIEDANRELDDVDRDDDGDVAHRTPHHRWTWRNPYYTRHRSDRSHTDDVVNVGDDSTLRAGQRADSVVSVFGSSTSEGDAGDVVSVFGNTRVTGPVRDDAVAVFGDTYIDSKVGGDAVAVFGTLQLGPHAEIDGDVTAVGGRVVRDPAAIVHGDAHAVLGGNFGGRFNWFRTWIDDCLFYGRPLSLHHGLGWAWGVALTFLALYLLFAVVFREGLTRCVETFEAQPGRSILAGFIAMLLTPVLLVLLCVTVVGIAAVPFVVIALFCVGLFGKAVMLAWIGRRLIRVRGTGTGTGPGMDIATWDHPAAAVLVGGLVVLVLYLVPVLGFVVYKVLGFLGFGTVVYTLISAARARQLAKHPPVGPGSGGAAAAAMAGGAAFAGATMAGSNAASAGPISAGPSVDPAAMAGQNPSGVAGLAGAGAAMGGAGAPFGTASAAGGAPGVAGGAGTAGAVPGAAGAAMGGAGASYGTASAAAPLSAAALAALPRATFWVRMGALFLDLLLVGFAASVLHPIFHFHLLLLAAYGAIMWKLRGTTVGGIVFDLRVVRLDGRELDWETAIVRALSCFLSLAVVGLGFFWIAFDDAKQAWHDKIAGTVVVRVPRPVHVV